MMLTTGMLMLGKMSVGVRKMATPPTTRIKIDITTNVYGRFSASLTIHMFVPLSRYGVNFCVPQPTPLTGDPLPDERGAVPESGALSLDLRQEAHGISVHQLHIV